MSDVPEEREQRWADALFRYPSVADAILVRQMVAKAMAVADAEVAAERQRLHDRIEALAAPVSGTDDYYAGWVAAASEILALVSEASASSPVSDDTGGTKP